MPVFARGARDERGTVGKTQCLKGNTHMDLLQIHNSSHVCSERDSTSSHLGKGVSQESAEDQKAHSKGAKGRHPSGYMCWFEGFRFVLTISWSSLPSGGGNYLLSQLHLQRKKKGITQAPLDFVWNGWWKNKLHLEIKRKSANTRKNLKLIACKIKTILILKNIFSQLFLGNV